MADIKGVEIRYGVMETFHNSTKGNKISKTNRYATKYFGIRKKLMAQEESFYICSLQLPCSSVSNFAENTATGNMLLSVSPPTEKLTPRSGSKEDRKQAVNVTRQCVVYRRGSSTLYSLDVKTRRPPALISTHTHAEIAHKEL